MNTTRLLWTTLALATAAAGCGGRLQHFDPAYGSSNDTAFAAQHVRRAPPAVAITGLDSQEAAILSDRYRASLAAKGQKVGEEPMLYVAPQNRERPIPLAPSVPKEK